MQFQVSQRFAHGPRQVAEAYTDPELYPSLVGLPKLGRIEVVSHARQGDRATVHVRYRFTDPLPAAVTAVVDPARLSWVQETVFDLAAGTTRFTMVPDHYPDRLSASGTARLVPEGEGARREVSGQLKVRALLVAGRVEAAIVDGLREYLVAEAPKVDAYLLG